MGITCKMDLDHKGKSDARKREIRRKEKKNHMGITCKMELDKI